jgi:hypothetical protein
VSLDVDPFADDCVEYDDAEALWEYCGDSLDATGREAEEAAAEWEAKQRVARILPKSRSSGRRRSNSVAMVALVRWRIDARRPPEMRGRLRGPRSRGAGRPAARRVACCSVRGGDSGDSDPDLGDEPPSRWRRYARRALPLPRPP